MGPSCISRLKVSHCGKEVFSLGYIQRYSQASGELSSDLGCEEAPAFYQPKASKSEACWSQMGWTALFRTPYKHATSNPDWKVTPLSFTTLYYESGELPYSGGLSHGTHPHGGLAAMGLLQPEDLGHHVLCGGMQQDPPRGQAHHYISAHWGQAHRNGIGT